MLNNNILDNSIYFFEDLDESIKNQLEYESLLVDIASEIINYRIDKGLSQKELSKKLEISQAMVSKIESGEYNPSIKFLFDISKKLNLNLVVGFENSNDYEFKYIVNNTVEDEQPYYLEAV